MLGPSGSGKSTLLRLIAGLEAPEVGEIWLDGSEITFLAPEARRVGLVFQDYALFPHLSVWENIAFGLREARWDGASIRQRLTELLDLTHLGPHAQKRPHQLSGGERQRVALARALASRPRLLLLDEPLGALDLKLRNELLWELRAILRQTEVPTIVVTHDQSEAFVIADQVALLRNGAVVQTGSPEQLFRNPKNAWVAGFLGHRNLLSAQQSQQVGLPARPHLLPPEAITLGHGEEARVEERVLRVLWWASSWSGEAVGCTWRAPSWGFALAIPSSYRSIGLRWLCWRTARGLSIRHSKPLEPTKRPVPHATLHHSARRPGYPDRAAQSPGGWEPGYCCR